MPGVKTTERFVSARLHGQSMTGAGAALTVEGWLGRDPGAVMGRKDGGFGLDAVQLKAGETTIVDGRFEITAHRDLDILPPDKVICDRLYPNVPELFRRTLIYFHDQHDEPVSMFESLASVRCLTRDRLEHLTSTV